MQASCYRIPHKICSRQGMQWLMIFMSTGLRAFNYTQVIITKYTVYMLKCQQWILQIYTVRSCSCVLHFKICWSVLRTVWHQKHHKCPQFLLQVKMQNRRKYIRQHKASNQQTECKMPIHVLLARIASVFNAVNSGWSCYSNRWELTDWKMRPNWITTPFSKYDSSGNENC